MLVSQLTVQQLAAIVMLFSFLGAELMVMTMTIIEGETFFLWLISLGIVLMLMWYIHPLFR